MSEFARTFNGPAHSNSLNSSSGRLGSERQSNFGWQPLHLQVRNALLHRIASGEWAGGASLPNEAELAQEYGLSGGTIRRALEWLEQARIIVRMQGRGTFVREQSAPEIEARYERLSNVDASPLADFIESVMVTEARADEHESTWLKIAEGAGVWRVERFRTIEGKPHVLELAALPRDLIGKCDATRYSIADVANANGVLLGPATERVLVEPPPLWVAQQLALPPDLPIMTLDRVIQTVQGRPVEWRKCYCASREACYNASLA